ncbi:glycosyltransferase family A protein [Microvirga solisilvae]|uniref:glycosyltransferase family A protein n=1 Tax=Microvirga solisilvae TaxID=2919498 RepID=UPI001FB046E8|nr:glycosyltransferase family A protein [Microvirga solisilvae]
MQEKLKVYDNGIVFLSLARNCAKFLPKLFALLEKTASQGIQVAAVVGENGSTDGTGDCLKSRQLQSRDVVHVDTSFMSSMPSRLRRMAEGREMLLRYAAERFPDVKYVCVIDVDNVLATNLSSEMLLETADQIYAKRNIFGVSATSAPYYYDISALRCSAFFEKNIYPEIMSAKGNMLGYYKFMRDNLFKVQREFTRSHVRLCESAFNGLCVYRPSDYFSSSYIGEDQDDVCEHVILNQRIANSTGEKILVDNRLILAMPPEHGPQSFASFMGRRALKVSGMLG